MVEVLYGEYRDPDAVQKVNPHLHNMPVQIAAERDLSPFLESSLATRPDLAVAVVRHGIEVPSAWRAVAEGSGWVLAERTFSAPESRRP